MSKKPTPRPATTPPPRRGTAGHRSTVRASKMTTISAPPHHARGREAAAQKIRCSRPLCSSQTTTRTTPPAPPPRGGAVRVAGTRTGTPHGGPHPEQPPPPSTDHSALTGNGRSCCPRTQQCANTPTPIRPRRPRFHTPGATPRPTGRGAHSGRGTTGTTGRSDQGHHSLMFHPRATRRPTRGTETGQHHGPPRTPDPTTRAVMAMRSLERR